MPLAAVYEVHTNRNKPVNPVGTAITKSYSPADGVVPTALTGDFSAGSYVTASVLGTGMNTDRLTNVREAV